MRTAFLVVSLLLAPTVWSQTVDALVEDASDSPWNVIAVCAESLDEPVGLSDAEAACPGLEQALEDSGYSPFISDRQLDALSGDVLIDLEQLAQRFRRSEAANADSIDLASLGPVLDSLRKAQQAEAPLTWFGRLKKWLREALDRQQGDADSWLTRWLDRVEVSESVSNAILYGAVILVILLAVAVVINEARVAGWLRRRSGKARDAGDSRNAASGPLTLADLDRAARNDQPSLLLRMLVQTLINTGRLRADRSLTHRELGSRAAFDDAEARACFQRVATLAERVVYGGGLPMPADAEPIVEAGRALNERLAGVAP